MPKKNNANVPSDKDCLGFASEHLRKAQKINHVVQVLISKMRKK